MALAHCILGKFLGVVCHCFPSPLDVPTFAARCLYICNDARDPSSERWNWGENCPVILPKFWLPRKFRDLLHAANLWHGTDGSSWSSGKEFYLVMPVSEKDAVLMLLLSIPCHWIINTNFKPYEMLCCVSWQIVAVGSAGQDQAV